MLLIRKFNYLSLRFSAAQSELFIRNFSDSKKDGSDSDSDRESKKDSKKKTARKEETAADRLNKLLASMQTDDNLNMSKHINMAKPGAIKKRSKQSDSSNILEAIKNVSSHLGEENKQQTESELLNKLLNHSDVETSSSRTAKQEKTNANELSLSDLIVGMKIDRRQPAQEYSRSDYVRKTLASRPSLRTKSTNEQIDRTKRQQKRKPAPNSGSVNLFGEKGLGIFKDTASLCDSPDILKTWDHLNQHDLKLAVTHPPANYFQKMALWTEQGKLWKFPIDNEQGMNEEAATDFSEHVFLEQHLENWCPARGPIRHFMELVCVGLSKNPYISAREKKAHILWYRDYFEEKKDILRDVIVERKSTDTNISKN